MVASLLRAGQVLANMDAMVAKMEEEYKGTFRRSTANRPLTAGAIGASELSEKLHCPAPARLGTVQRSSAMRIAYMHQITCTAQGLPQPFPLLSQQTLAPHRQ